MVPATQDQWTLHSLNIHGTFFERACRDLIAKRPGWDIVGTNIPVEFPTGSNPSNIDVWAQHTKKTATVNLLIECKQRNQDLTNWVFFEGDPKRPFMIRDVETTTKREQNRPATQLVSLNHSVGIGEDPRETRSNYIETAMKANSKLTKTSNDGVNSAARQAAIGALAAFAKADRSSRKLKAKGLPVPIHQYFIPVVMTTAKLYICKYTLGAVDLETGRVDLSKATLQEVPQVAYQYPLPVNMQYVPNDDILNASNWANHPAFETVSVFVVNSLHIKDFLKDQAGI